jgi:hypothetical protein
VLRGSAEVVIRAEQDQIVSAAELNEYRIDGSDLDAATAARVADLCSFDVIFTARLNEPKRSEPLDQLPTPLWTGKALKELLQHQTRGKDLVCPLKGMLQGLHFRHGRFVIAAEGERSDARVDEQAHGLRARSAL